MIKSDEQKHFLFLEGMSLEHFARNVFGNKFFGSAGWTEISSWKMLYLDCLTLIANSFDRSVGFVDAHHRDHIFETIAKTSGKIRASKRKDDIHMWLIIGLFSLVFLLLGNLPRRMATNKKSHRKSFNFSGFRTLSYSQSSEQFGFLLRSRIEGDAKRFGFEDSFEAQMAYARWAKDQKKMKKKSAYVEWVRSTFPNLYSKMK